MSEIFGTQPGSGAPVGGEAVAPPPAAPVQPPELQPPPALPVDEQASPIIAADAAAESPAPLTAPEVVPGIPLWIVGEKPGDTNVFYLSGLDLDASHEVGQPARHAGIDGDRQVAGIGAPVARSGGAAYYYNAVTGRGFSVPINPKGV